MKWHPRKQQCAYKTPHFTIDIAGQPKSAVHAKRHEKHLKRILHYETVS